MRPTIAYLWKTWKWMEMAGHLFSLPKHPFQKVNHFPAKTNLKQKNVSGCSTQLFSQQHFRPMSKTLAAMSPRVKHCLLSLPIIHRTGCIVVFQSTQVQCGLRSGPNPSQPHIRKKAKLHRLAEFEVVACVPCEANGADGDAH